MSKPRKGDRVTVDSLTKGTIATVSRGVAYVDIDGGGGARLPVMLREMSPTIPKHWRVDL